MPIKIDGGQAVVIVLTAIVGIGTLNLVASSMPNTYFAKCWHALMTQ